MQDTFQCHDQMTVNKKTYSYYSLAKIEKTHKLTRLPFCLKILLENLLRYEDGINVTRDDIEALLNWDPTQQPSQEIAFTPSRVILQDFTGVPAIVDLAAMREAMAVLGGDPKKINPLSPVELVIDHSVMVDYFGNNLAFRKNTHREFERNLERYAFLRWGQEAFENFAVVPPGTGIVHQVNLEYLARVVFEKEIGNDLLAYPDTLVGTDSHTTMINGLGILGWGVGGIEAEAAMLGQPITMLIPQVIGFELKGSLPEGSTATDLVLVVCEILRNHGVVGKFVEFFGEGLNQLPLADRATIANMAPEYGATCGIFPIDQETLNYLALTGRSAEKIAFIEAYCKQQRLFRDDSQRAEYSDVLVLDLSSVEPCIAGPKRPQDRIRLREAKANFQQQLQAVVGGRSSESSDDRSLNEGANIIEGEASLKTNAKEWTLHHGAVVIAAITSCTNTSNPAVMLAAGLLAKNARKLGLQTKPWVKTSLAPGSQVVMDYLNKADVQNDLDALGFNLVGFGCTTCIGNSGPLPEPVSDAIRSGHLAVAAVLSGNRNFEGRIHPEVSYAYLASPPLVVAYALAGTMDIDLLSQPLGENAGKAIFLKDIWPTPQEINTCIQQNVEPEMFRERYKSVYEGDQEWRSMALPQSERYVWEEDSTYVKHPPFFEKISKNLPVLQDLQNCRVLVKVGDSVTTDHISPAGAIEPDSPAGKYLLDKGISIHEFNSYGSRRGNHEVMMRGTFANIRLKNQLAPGTEGGWTTLLPSREVMTIFAASEAYRNNNIPLIILAGKEYGTGSSRDWAAKGPSLLGVKVVIAESFERIHRSNLIGMGILPLEYKIGTDANLLGLTGHETYNIPISQVKPGATLMVEAHNQQGKSISFETKCRIDTPKEMEYFKNGGILHYVLRKLAS